MVQFGDSLSQRSEVQISIRVSYSDKIVYEKKKIDELWPTTMTYCTPELKKILVDFYYAYLKLFLEILIEWKIINQNKFLKKKL